MHCNHTTNLAIPSAIQRLKTGCQKHKIGSLLLSARCLKNNIKVGHLYMIFSLKQSTQVKMSHPDLSCPWDTGISSFRNLDIAAYEFYDIAHQLYCAALNSKCVLSLCLLIIIIGIILKFISSRKRLNS